MKKNKREKIDLRAKIGISVFIIFVLIFSLERPAKDSAAPGIETSPLD